MKRRFGIVLTPEPDGLAYNVTSPEIPELVTFGSTREEAIAMAVDCAQLLILTDLDAGNDIPEEGGRAEIETIEVDLDALREQHAAERAEATA